jgi:hypothetical protein
MVFYRENLCKPGFRNRLGVWVEFDGCWSRIGQGVFSCSIFKGPIHYTRKPSNGQILDFNHQVGTAVGSMFPPRIVFGFGAGLLSRISHPIASNPRDDATEQSR